MKKITSLLIAALLLVSFAACDDSGEDVRGSVSGGNTVATTAAVAESNGGTLELGSTNGAVYENKFIGIGCELDSDWTFYSDEQIEQLNKESSQYISDDYAEIIENASLVYDMYAVSANGTDTINVNLEKVDSAQLATLDIEENYKTLSSDLISVYEGMGYTDISYEIEDVSIGGKSFPAMKISTKFSGIDAYFLTLNIKCDGYLACMTIGTFYTDNINTLLESFYLT